MGLWAKSWPKTQQCQVLHRDALCQGLVTSGMCSRWRFREVGCAACMQCLGKALAQTQLLEEMYKSCIRCPVRDDCTLTACHYM